MTASRKALVAGCLSSALGLAFCPPQALAADPEILKRIEALEAELKALKAQVTAQDAARAAAPAAIPAPPAAAPGEARPLVTSATDGLTIFGRLDLGIESSHDGATTRIAVQSQKSSIGFGARRALTQDLTALMQIDTTVAPDDNANSTTFASRNSFVGLRSNTWGTLLAGRHDEPVKLAQGSAAPVWASADAMETIINGKAMLATITGQANALGGVAKTRFINDPANGWAHFHNRLKNVVMYQSPKFFGFETILQYGTDEINGAPGTIRKPTYGGLLQYDDKTWNFAVATETLRNFSARDKNLVALKFTGGYRAPAWSVGLAYSRIDNHAGRRTGNWLIAGTWDLGPVILKANHGVGSESWAGARDGSKMSGVELNHPFDKWTNFYTYYAIIDNDENAYGRFETGTNLYATPAKGLDPHVVGLGMRYQF